MFDVSAPRQANAEIMARSRIEILRFRTAASQLRDHLIKAGGARLPWILRESGTSRRKIPFVKRIARVSVDTKGDIPSAYFFANF